MPRQNGSSDIRRSVGQLLIIGFEGTEMSPGLAAQLTRLQPAGVIHAGDFFNSYHPSSAALSVALDGAKKLHDARIPFVVIREIIENLIHAFFEGAVISILNDGNTIRISDHGPGIINKALALEPGFTTATPAMRQFIKGVGSGLPVAREQLAFLGGAITLEDNLTRGTVVTLSVGAGPTKQLAGTAHPPERPALTARQKKVLLLIAELGSAGPSVLAKELGVSQSTAYRELELLERGRLIASKAAGKRTLTEDGITALGDVFEP